MPQESRASQRSSFPRGVHPAAASRQPAAAPSKGFSESVIAAAACQSHPASSSGRQQAAVEAAADDLPVARQRCAGSVRSSRHRVERRCYASSAHRGQGLITSGQRAEGAAAGPSWAPPGASRRIVFMYEDYHKTEQEIGKTTWPAQHSGPHHENHRAQLIAACDQIGIRWTRTTLSLTQCRL